MPQRTPDILRELTIYAASVIAVTLSTETPITQMGYSLGDKGITTQSEGGGVTVAVNTPLGPVELSITAKAEESS